MRKKHNEHKQVNSNWQHRLKNKVVKSLDLPKDLIFDLPRTTMIGDMQLYVENHIGLLEFSDTKIRLHTRAGELFIYGADLVIRGVMYREILIEGKIDNIKWKMDGNQVEG